MCNQTHVIGGPYQHLANDFSVIRQIAWFLAYVQVKASLGTRILACPAVQAVQRSFRSLKGRIRDVETFE